jgi:hypothetical protein
MKSQRFISLKNIIIGFLLILPFIILSIIAGNEIEPFFSFFNISGPSSFMQNPIGFLALIICLFLLLAAATVILLTLFRKEKDGRRRIYIINLTLKIIIFGYFVMFVVVCILMMIGF